MALDSVRYRASVSVPVIATGTTYNRPATGSQQDENIMCVRVISDVDFHVAWNRPATTADARVPADRVEHYNLSPSDVLHFVRANTNGDILVTVM